MARAYNSVGSMALLSVFPCGHSFRSHRLIAHVTRCTTETQKQLTLLGNESRKEISGSLNEEDPIMSMTPGDEIHIQFHEETRGEYDKSCKSIKDENLRLLKTL